MVILNILACLACWAHFALLVPWMCNHASCAQVNELPQGHCDYWEATLFLQLHIYYAYFTSAQFEQSVCCRSLVTHDHHLYYIPWLELDEESLVQWYHQCPPQLYIYIYIYIYIIYNTYIHIYLCININRLTYAKTYYEQWTKNNI